MQWRWTESQYNLEKNVLYMSESHLSRFIYKILGYLYCDWILKLIWFVNDILKREQIRWRSFMWNVCVEIIATIHFHHHNLTQKKIIKTKEKFNLMLTTHHTYKIKFFPIISNIPLPKSWWYHVCDNLEGNSTCLFFILVGFCVEKKIYFSWDIKDIDTCVASE